MTPVLIVDDDSAIRSMLALALEDEGYDVATAKNGLEALQQLLTRPFSLVLLDLQMPVMDGLTLAQQLREQGVRVPIVLMSAGGRTRVAAQMARVAGYLEKPFSLDQLYATVATLVRTESPSSG
jgi:DNA-binding response OmpR family regulator